MQRLGYPRLVKVIRTPLIYVTGIVLGIVVGVWTASMQFRCFGLCFYEPPRFGGLECLLMGALMSAAVLVTALAVDSEFPTETAQMYRAISRRCRTVTRFLFEDLSRQQEQ
jgi:hypothetical protein